MSGHVLHCISKVREAQMGADLRMQVGGLLASTAAAVRLKRQCAAGPLRSAWLSSVYHLPGQGKLTSFGTCSIGYCMT